MHVRFIAMMLTVGADQDIFATRSTANTVRTALPTAAAGPSATMLGARSNLPEVPGPYRYDPPRDPQEADGLVHGFFMYCRAWFQPMPQTCYSPHYGCYPGNGRDIYRYPAFHGYYYRQGYNYRPLFEYPWQAAMHEPLPHEISSERATVGSCAVAARAASGVLSKVTRR